MEGLLGCWGRGPDDHGSQEGLQRKWFSFRLPKSNTDSGKTGCRGKVGDPELVVCAFLSSESVRSQCHLLDWSPNL